MAQDDYYYEIQLTNKQLVFYFLAGATGLVLSFLAGVMVGRGVDQTASAAEAAQVAHALPEDRIVTEEPPATTKPAPPAAEPEPAPPPLPQPAPPPPPAVISSVPPRLTAERPPPDAPYPAEPLAPPPP